MRVRLWHIWIFKISYRVTVGLSWLIKLCWSVFINLVFLFRRLWGARFLWKTIHWIWVLREKKYRWMLIIIRYVRSVLSLFMAFGAIPAQWLEAAVDHSTCRHVFNRRQWRLLLFFLLLAVKAVGLLDWWVFGLRNQKVDGRVFWHQSRWLLFLSVELIGSQTFVNLQGQLLIGVLLPRLRWKQRIKQINIAYGLVRQF